MELGSKSTNCVIVTLWHILWIRIIAARQRHLIVRRLKRWIGAVHWLWYCWVRSSCLQKCLLIHDWNESKDSKINGQFDERVIMNNWKRTSIENETYPWPLDADMPNCCVPPGTNTNPELKFTGKIKTSFISASPINDDNVLLFHFIYFLLDSH